MKKPPWQRRFFWVAIGVATHSSYTEQVVDTEILRSRAICFQIRAVGPSTQGGTWLGKDGLLMVVSDRTGS